MAAIVLILFLALAITIISSLPIANSSCPFFNNTNSGNIYAAGCYIRCYSKIGATKYTYRLGVAFLCNPATTKCIVAPNNEQLLGNSTKFLEEDGILENNYIVCVELFKCDLHYAVDEFCMFLNIFDNLNRTCLGYGEDYKDQQCAEIKNGPFYVCRDLENDRKVFDPKNFTVEDRESLPMTFRVCNSREVEIFDPSTHPCKWHYQKYDPIKQLCN